MIRQPSGNLLSNNLPLSGNPFFRHPLGNSYFIRNRNKSELVAGHLVAGRLLLLGSIHRAGPSFLSSKARAKGARIVKMHPLRRIVTHDLAIGIHSQSALWHTCSRAHAARIPYYCFHQRGEWAQPSQRLGVCRAKCRNPWQSSSQHHRGEG